MREVIEFTRIIQPVLLDDQTLRTQRSPDGQRAFIVTRRADVATDTNRFEVLLLDVSDQRLASRAPPAPMPLLSVLAQRDENDATPAVMDVRWSGNGTLLLRARIHDQPYQAYQLDVATHRLTQLTFAPHGVLAFDAASDRRRLVYLSPVPNPPMPPGGQSIVVGTNSFWTVHFGQHRFGNQQRRYQFFVTAAGARRGAMPLGEPFAEANLGVPAASISPDGRWALVPRFEAHRQLLWSRHYPYVADVMATYGASLTMDPLSYFSRPSSYVTRRVVAYRLSDRQEFMVLDAPDDAKQDTQARAPGLWQDGGRSVVIAGTFLARRPAVVVQDAASHVIEFWPDTGMWRDVATLQTRAKAAYAVTPAVGEPGGLSWSTAIARGASCGWRGRAGARSRRGRPRRRRWLEAAGRAGPSGQLTRRGKPEALFTVGASMGARRKAPHRVPRQAPHQAHPGSSACSRP
ncbi:hypothetical protein ACQ859_16515 [Roseateles chitinivorans]|uniref:hypothetical protein n=1 Tax=Roseateles chitinivorans TaxID=2917965 RepID=UPI003D67D2FA